MADVSHMQCCAVRELSELSEMELTSEGSVDYLKEIKSQLTDEGHYEEHYNWHTGHTEQGEWNDEVFHCPAFFIFSQAGTPTNINGSGAYGDYFRDFIIEEKLGTVLETSPAFNENSKNLVKVYLWTVDQDAFKAWSGKAARKKKEAA